MGNDRAVRYNSPCRLVLLTTLIVIVALCLGAVTLTLIITITHINSGKNQAESTMAAQSSTTTAPHVVQLEFGSFDPYQKQLIINQPFSKSQSNANGGLTINMGRLVGVYPQVMASTTPVALHVHWSETDTDLIITEIESQDPSLKVVQVQWTSKSLYSLRDDIVLSNAYWYGGAEMFHQYWPVNHSPEEIDIMPFTTNDIYKMKHGNVQERYWLSSNHIALTVDLSVPLWVGQNSSILSFVSQFKNSIYQNFIPDVTAIYPSLTYKIWYSAKTNSSLKDMQLAMIKNFLGKPSDIPDTRMMTDPIWSTWAKFKQSINQTQVLQFAQDISGHHFSNSQLEIDDRWQSHYGDLQFDEQKFPDASGMIKQLSAMGFRVTVWTHPFANVHSAIALNQSNWQYTVHDVNGSPLPLQWWNGIGFAIDSTNQAAADWYVQRLHNFKQQTGIHSYKFDAGETNWLGFAFRLANASQPDHYSSAYARMAARLGKDIEVRTASRTQSLPIFVRIMDKDSRWGYDNGLRTVINCALLFGVLGYPFALPDMVGGNAYGNGTNMLNGHAVPDPELFVRWLQANALLPALQFSIAPWDYDDQYPHMNVSQIAKDVQVLREKYKPLMIQLANESVSSGAPIVRPLWWLDESEAALTCDSQFLLGDDLLVAPILEADQRNRSVYLPSGNWTCAIDGHTYQGPTTIQQQVALNQLAYYTRT